MRKLGLTGGIGSGKSHVGSIFRKMGIPVYEADAEARQLQQSDSDLVRGIKALFGETVYLPDGTLDRKRVASEVFSDNEKLAQLNALVHPAVAKHFGNWLNQHSDAPLIVKEAAILFESGADKGLDAVIVVTAPEALRIERVMQRDTTSREEVLKRMQNQWSEDEKMKHAAYVVHNDGRELLLPQVAGIVAANGG